MIRSLSRLWWRRYLSRNALPWADLDRFPKLRPDHQRLEIARRLQEQIHYFGNREDALPEWRDAARIKDPLEIWRIWPSLPIVNKAMLRARFEPLEMRRRFQLEGRVDATGGSTGEPAHFFLDTQMTRAAVSADIYTRLKMGWTPGMPTAFIWGAERDIGKSVPLRTRIHFHLVNEIPVAGYVLNDQTIARVISVIRSRRPIALYGFTSMLDFVARGIIQAVGSVQGVAAAWNGGEMLFADQRERFRQAFGIFLRNRYGGRELSTIAAEFEEGSPLTILRPWLFLEIVDDSGKPVAPGEQGRLLCTSTICRGTPFLRYEIGDMGVSEASLENESGIGALAHLEGRVSGVMRLSDGRQINALFWNHLFKDYPEIWQFQVVIQSDNSLKLLFQGSGMPPERNGAITARLKAFLGQTRFEISWVGEIPRTKQGKLVQVIRS